MLWGQVWFTSFLCGTGRGCDGYSGAGRKGATKQWGKIAVKLLLMTPSIHRNARIIPQMNLISSRNGQCCC